MNVTVRFHVSCQSVLGHVLSGPLWIGEYSKVPMAVTKVFIILDSKQIQIIRPVRGVVTGGGVVTTPLIVHIVTVLAMNLVE